MKNLPAYLNSIQKLSYTLNFEVVIQGKLPANKNKTDSPWKTVCLIILIGNLLD